MKVDVALQAVLDAETAVRDGLRAVGDRHRADHDVLHMTGTLGHLVAATLDRLAVPAGRYGVEPAGSPGERGDTRPEPALELLHDLRELHLRYAAASIDWVVLGQGAQAVRDTELLDLVGACHPQTLRGLRWTVTRIKAAAPQVLAT